MPPTVQDVAHLAGVSTQTVSRVLNGSTAVAPRTRRKVLRSIDRLAYHTDAVARSLRRGRTQTLGLLFSNIYNPSFVAELRGVDEVVRPAGYTVLLSNSDESLEQEQKLARTLLEHRVDGVLFIPVGDGSVETLRAFRSARVPCVVLNRTLPDADVVAYDNRGGGKIAADHLIRLGHRRLGLITARQSVATARERREGCLSAMAEAGLPPDALLAEEAGFDLASGHAAVRRLFERSAENHPTALIATTNFATLGALRALSELGLAVPSDVALVGFGDLDWSSAIQPPLTTVAADPRLLGRRAATLLLERWGTEPDRPAQCELFPMELRVRSSCGATATELPRSAPCSSPMIPAPA